VKIRVLAFASAATAVGSSEIEIDVAEGSNLQGLQNTLSGKYPDLGPLWDRLALAIDGELVGSDALLREGAEVALLPPVSGGRPGRAQIADAPIDLAALMNEVSPADCGATVLFIGTVRDHHQDRQVERLTYQAYRPMAEAALERIARELEATTEGLSVRIVHRLGDLAVGESSVVITTSAAHRVAAYEASRTALERLKREVPIWKREWYSNGEAAWREEELLGPPSSGD
jgi:molybdopterin synthase catalytic subunit